LRLNRRIAAFERKNRLDGEKQLARNASAPSNGDRRDRLGLAAAIRFGSGHDEHEHLE
jgi:hypothetical protein